MDNKSKIRWTIVLGTACAWFGQHCGSGFCSGVQIAMYHGRLGFWSLFSTVIPFILLAFAFYNMGEYARRIKAHSYKEVASTLYSDNAAVGKVTLFLWDLSVLSNVLISGGAVVAGAATLLQQVFGFNYALSSIVFAIIVTVICMFGAIGLTRISLPLVGIMVVLIGIVATVLIRENWTGLEQIVVTQDTFEATPYLAVRNTIIYTGLASNFICAFMAIAPNFNNSKESKYTAIFGAILNCVMLSLVSLALLSCMPGIADAKLPILQMISDRFGIGGGLTVAYQGGLYLAYVTTGVGNVFAAVSRFGAVFNKQEVRNQKLVDALLAIAFLTVAVFMAQFGLAALVDKGYKFLSYMRFPLYVLGGLIFVPIRFRSWKKKEAAQMQTEAEVQA